ncbi:MATE family efflux transporter [Phytoactinopolyspora mesophila]|uniref:MATE family efflux transporter n=1 Tax=Phytoactinopolyspora mesophila TaxID=2650750 RepID=A0A7K3MD54_9ACTN|nr:MATE family efflux transporter [Phytoactinopolyspora mesophila]NDL61130.1 MATE family efflux transporter [Phytoactinopolyspora mesophila]
MKRRPTAFHRHPADGEILRLALPALGALVAEPLFLIADSAIVGQLGTPELAGLGIAAAVLSTLVNVSIFLAYGTTAAVARMLGANDLPGALRAGIDGCWLAILIGAGTLAVGWPLTPWIVERFGPAPEVAEHAETYLQISLLGIPPMLLVLAATGVLRGLQDTRTPLYVAGSGAAGNVVLNVILVHGFQLGIAGSAIGTVIAQTAMAAVFIRVVARAARRHGASLKPHWPGVRRSFGAGVPLIVRTVAMRVALITTTVVATGLGTAELAAHQVAFTTWTLLALILDAVAIAAQALVGRALGAGNIDEARSVTRRMVQWGVLTGFALTVVVLAVASVYAPLFTQDQEVRSLLVAALIVAALLQPLAGWVFVLDGVLIGAGDGRYLAWASVLSVVVFLPAAFAVMFLSPSGTAGIVALWGAIGLWTVARLITLDLRERRGAWAVTGSVR